jgi:hypothetical protein
MNQIPLVQLLLKFKADPNDTQTDAQPLLFSALSDTNMLEVLLAAGARLEVTSPDERQWTPLGAAANGNLVPAMTLLLQHGANPNVRNRNGVTPLHWAAYQSEYQLTTLKTLDLLLANKADPNVRSSNGETPLDCVKKRIQPNSDSGPSALAEQLADLLRRHGALDRLPDWDRITVSRPAANYSQWIFKKGTNDWNHFTLLELICTYAIQYQNYAPSISFADLTRLTVVRPGLDGLTSRRLEVNLLNSANGLDFTKDIPLQFGDVVEIPERDHPLAESPKFLPDNVFKPIWENLGHKIGAAQLVVAGGPTVPLPLEFMDPYIGSELRSDAARHALTSNSDLSCVKVTRHDPKTGKTSEWRLDCSGINKDSNSYPNYTAPDLRLRDGDLIEVPEKRLRP